MHTDHVTAPPLTRQVILTQILESMITNARLDPGILISSEGLPVAAASSPFDVDTLAAVLALVRNTIHRARTQLGADSVDEGSIVAHDRARLVCRDFTIGDEELVLAVTAPVRRAYRRATNRALKQVWH